MATTILNVEQAFYTGDYTSVINAEINDNSRVRELQARALIATKRTEEALEIISQDETSLHAALRLYAENKTEGLNQILDSNPDNATKHIIALVFAIAGEYEKALDILSSCAQSLDAVFLKVHIYLLLNKVSAAQGEVDAARSWANDHVIFNVAEALVCLRNNAAQKAFFIYEENNSLNATPSSSLGEAVSQTLLRRFPEASEAIKGTSSWDNEAVLVSSLALDLIQNNTSEVEELRNSLKKSQYSDAAAVIDIKEKEALFDEAVKKFKK